MTALRIYVDYSGSTEALSLLREETKGHELIFAHRPGGSVLHEAGADPKLADADIAFGQPDPRGIENAHRLKWIQVSSSGITRYDNPMFRALMAKRQIAVTNSAGVYDEPCAIHALSFILAQSRCLPAGLASRASNGSPEWNNLRNTCSLLRDKTILLVGYGAIGHRLAELLKPFEAKVIVYRRKPLGDENVPTISQEQLAAALATADHVVDILPDSAETRHFFNAARFAQMKEDVVFYNIGRGATVDQPALVDALRTRLAAAWLDVTEPEPLPNGHPLLNAPNCFITPHIAGGHTDESGTLVRHFLKNFGRFLNNETLVDRVM